MIHILIQLGISVMYLYAIDFLNLLGDSCFALNVISSGLPLKRTLYAFTVFANVF